MAKGRGARRAVWVQPVMEEAARERGLSSGAVLIDLIKAFGHLLLEDVWHAGARAGFRMSILRASFECSTFTRRSVYRGACNTSSIRTNAAVLPGLEHSTDFTLLALMGPLDKLSHAHQGLSIFVIADDTGICIHGTEQEVEERLLAAPADCTQELKVARRMQVSRNKVGFNAAKTMATVSSDKLGVFVKRKMGGVGIGLCKGGRNLGVEFGAGRGKLKRVVRGAKWKEARGKFVLALELGRSAAPMITRAALAVSFGYGAEVPGDTDGMLKGWRTMVAMSFGPIAGGSTTARLALEAADPGKNLVAKAVMS